MDQDFQNSNQLKFSIASLLFNDNLTSKKAINLDQPKSSTKYDQYLSENNNNCLDLSCLPCESSSFKNLFSLCHLQKKNKIKEAFNVNNSKLNCEPFLSQQINQHFNQQLNQQLNQQINQQLNQQTITNRTITPSINSSFTSPFSSSFSCSIQSQLQQQSQNQQQQTSSTNSTTTNLQLNKHTKININQTQINNYLNSLNSNTGNGGGKMTHHHSINNKKKRNRTIFTNEQLQRLELEFERTQYMVGHDRLSLAAELKLNEVQVKVWFQNRRIKHRRNELVDKKHLNLDRI